MFDDSELLSAESDGAFHFALPRAPLPVRAHSALLTPSAVQRLAAMHRCVCAPARRHVALDASETYSPSWPSRTERPSARESHSPRRPRRRSATASSARALRLRQWWRRRVWTRTKIGLASFSHRRSGSHACVRPMRTVHDCDVPSPPHRARPPLPGLMSCGTAHITSGRTRPWAARQAAALLRHCCRCAAPVAPRVGRPQAWRREPGRVVRRCGRRLRPVARPASGSVERHARQQRRP